MRLRGRPGECQWYECRWRAPPTHLIPVLLPLQVVGMETLRATSKPALSQDNLKACTFSGQPTGCGQFLLSRWWGYNVMLRTFSVMKQIDHLVNWPLTIQFLANSFLRGYRYTYIYIYKTWYATWYIQLDLLPLERPSGVLSRITHHF